MKFSETSIPGVLVFTTSAHRDERGFFARTYDAEVASQAGIRPDSFVQDSLSRSGRGVLRGLHIRAGLGEAKLVRCSSGAIFDVVVDLRPDSPTFGTWESSDLDGDSQTSVHTPARCRCRSWVSSWLGSGRSRLSRGQGRRAGPGG
jgi:dTDP-4-dehydrorhamnose 3,5-epimerase